METAIIVALITAAVGIIGYFFDRKGKRESAAQQAKANELTERQQDWERRGDIIDDLTTHIQTMQNQIDRLVAKGILDQEEIEYLRTSKQGILNTVRLLQGVLQDEVAVALAQLEIDTATQEHRGGHDTDD